MKIIIEEDELRTLEIAVDDINRIMMPPVNTREVLAAFLDTVPFDLDADGKASVNFQDNPLGVRDADFYPEQDETIEIEFEVETPLDVMNLKNLITHHRICGTRYDVAHRSNEDY